MVRDQLWRTLGEGLEGGPVRPSVDHVDEAAIEAGEWSTAIGGVGGAAGGVGGAAGGGTVRGGVDAARRARNAARVGAAASRSLRLIVSRCASDSSAS